MTTGMIRWTFLAAGIYDFVIGFVFLFAGGPLFDWARIPHPNHWAYIQFGSLMLMVFGTMFLKVAYSPSSNRNLIPFGMLLKVCYIGIVAFYWLTTGVPMLFKPFAFIDALMLVLFGLAYASLARPESKLGTN
jgi:hypothetical protein